MKTASLIRKNLFIQSSQKGFIALICIAIITAVIILVAISANLLSISEGEMGLGKNQSSNAYFLASACAEEALMQIRNSILFSGNGYLSFSNGTCSYQVINQDGQNRLINSSSTVSSITRKIQVTIDQIVPTIRISSWQDVADF